MVAAACFLSAGPTLAAGAQPRAWVSGLGLDAATCGAITTPCRTLQYSHDNVVAPGGSIYVKDPANYGQLVIRQAISIINDGSGTATILATSGDAVAVQAASTDVVLLKGLTLDGAGTGTTGVKVTLAGKVAIEDCTIQSFVTASGGNGVLITPTQTGDATPLTFLIANSRLIGNGPGGSGFTYVMTLPQSGLAKFPIGQIRGTTISGSFYGVFASGPGSVLVADSVIEGAGLGVGLFVDRNNALLLAKRARVDGMANGVDATNTGTVTLSQSVFTHNQIDIATLQARSRATANSASDSDLSDFNVIAFGEALSAFGSVQS